MKVKENVLNQIKENERNKNCNVFIEELTAIYESEKKLNLTLPKMILEAKSSEIAAGLTEHLKFTQEHLLRLETFFKSVKQSLKT